MITLGALVWFVVYVLIIAVIAYLLILGVDYVVKYIGLPEIITKVLKVIIAVVAVLVVLNMIIPFVGSSNITPLKIK